MEIKMLEVRDRATFMSMMAIKLSSRSKSEQYLLERVGYAIPLNYILLMNMEENRINHNPYSWEGQRTPTTIHKHLIDHWDDVKSGDVLDVEFLLGEVKTPKISECKDS